MMKFIKNAFSELDHVVWPTPAESKKYMIYTITVIIILATLLSLVGYVIREGLSGARNQFDHEPTVTSTASGEEFVTEAELKKLEEELKQSTTGTASELSLPIVPTPTGTGTN